MTKLETMPPVKEEKRKTKKSNNNEKMFADIRKFSKERTPKQAIGWYICIVLAGLVIAFLLGAILGGILGSMGYAITKIESIAFTFWTILAPIMTIGCGAFLAKEKRLLDRKAIIALILVGGLTYLWGIIAGVIPLAVATTLKNGKKEKNLE